MRMFRRFAGAHGLPSFARPRACCSLLLIVLLPVCDSSGSLPFAVFSVVGFDFAIAVRPL
jgi:hypothetical protein